MNMTAVLRGAKHFALSAGPKSGAEKLALAAARVAAISPELFEPIERCVAASLATSVPAEPTVDAAQVGKAIEGLCKALGDDKDARVLRDYAKQHIGALVQHCQQPSFAWDF